jgi:hypothetical protein
MRNPGGGTDHERHGVTEHGGGLDRLIRDQGALTDQPA